MYNVHLHKTAFNQSFFYRKK